MNNSEQYKPNLQELLKGMEAMALMPTQMDKAVQHWKIMQKLNTNFNDLANKVKSFMVIGKKGEGLIVETEDGEAFWFGKMQFGLDKPTIAMKPTQLDVPRLFHMVQGHSHILFLNRQGQIYSMGINQHGQLGLGTVDQQTHFSPQFISNPSEFTSVRCGDGHSLALTKDGRVWAWGWNHYGQVGMPSSTADTQPFPFQISELNPHRVVAVECGAHHSLALTDQGEVYAWGKNDDGQLGDGSKTSQHTATQIHTSSPVISIAAGESHTLLVIQTQSADQNSILHGEVYACGSNKYGQLGLPTITESSSRLSKVSGLLSFSQIASHPATNLSIALSFDILPTERKEPHYFVWGQMANGTPISTPCKLNSFYSTVDSSLSFFSTHCSTPHSVQMYKIPVKKNDYRYDD